MKTADDKLSSYLKSITVRKAEAEDAASIAEVLFETDPFIYPTAFIDAEGARTQFPAFINMIGNAYHYSNIVVAEDGKEVVGAICYFNNSVDSRLDYYSVLDINSFKLKHVCDNYFNHLHSYVEVSNEYYIVAICVSEGYRGKGIGKMLLKSVLYENSDQRFKLDVLCNNEAAICLYKELGFQIVGDSYKGYACPPIKRPDCFCMVLDPFGNIQSEES